MIKVVELLAEEREWRRNRDRRARGPGRVAALPAPGSRFTRPVAARLSGFFVCALVALALACGDRDEPMSTGPTAAPELANNPSCSKPSTLPTWPNEVTLTGTPTVAQRICTPGNMSPANAQSALVKWTALIRGATPSNKAISLATGGGLAGLVDFLRKNWTGSQSDLDDLIHDIILLVTGQEGESVIVPPTGGSVPSPGGDAVGDFPPGWSDTPRIWISTQIPCNLNTTLDQYGNCVHNETIPNLPFEEAVLLIQCFVGPDGVNPILAKNKEDFDDPLGTNHVDSAGEIEYFEDSAPADDPPDCPTALANRITAPASGGSPSPGALAGQKGGPSSGLRLQKGVGSRISSFSDWGFVDLESATIEGTVSSSSNGPIAGAAVEIFCLGEGTPRLATTTGGDGHYSLHNFDGDTHLFSPGESCSVKASAAGFGSKSTAAADVAQGLTDDVNLALDGASSIQGVISKSFSSTKIAGATVDLFCDGDVSPRQSATTPANGSYAFDGTAGVGGFSPGDECEVVASASDFVSRSSGAFTVAAGQNLKNLALDRLILTGTFVEGAVRFGSARCGSGGCSSLVGGADVELTCHKGTAEHPPSFSATTRTGSLRWLITFGRYAFVKVAPGFGPGWECTVSASSDGKSGATGPFNVRFGKNSADITIF
jgi:hypothetical protein